MNRDLLLVIDFQNVYLPGQEWACPSMPEAMENTRRLLDAQIASKVLFTQFLAAQHPEGTWKTYAEEYRHINADPFLCDIADPMKPYILGMESSDTPVDLLPNTPALRYPLAVKSTYSSMKCEQVLQAARGCDRILLAGVVAECCIVATMLDAMDLGYQVIYLTDCVAGQNETNEAAIRQLAESFAPMHTLVTTADALITAGYPGCV